MNTKIIVFSAAAICSYLGSVDLAKAEGELSYNLGAVSHYLWRGFDLNAGAIALQGGLDYEDSSGFYAGAWASQYDFGDDDDGAEIDLYLGYSLELNDTFGLDFSVTNYQYTGDSGDSTELKVGLVTELFEINYHRDFDLKTDYLELNGSYALNAELSLGGHFGVNDDGEENNYDYALTLNYLLNETTTISGGYSDHELDEEGAEGTFFIGVLATF